jgi:hypothetical protein
VLAVVAKINKKFNEDKRFKKRGVGRHAQTTETEKKEMCSTSDPFTQPRRHLKSASNNNDEWRWRPSSGARLTCSGPRVRHRSPSLARHSNRFSLLQSISTSTSEDDDSDSNNVHVVDSKKHGRITHTHDTQDTHDTHDTAVTSLYQPLISVETKSSQDAVIRAESVTIIDIETHVTDTAKEGNDTAKEENDANTADTAKANTADTAKEENDTDTADTAKEENDTDTAKEENDTNTADTAKEENDTNTADTAKEENDTDTADTAKEENDTDTADTAKEENDTDTADTAKEENDTDTADTAKEENDTDTADTAKEENDTDTADTAKEENDTDTADTDKEDVNAEDGSNDAADRSAEKDAHPEHVASNEGRGSRVLSPGFSDRYRNQTYHLIYGTQSIEYGDPTRRVPGEQLPTSTYSMPSQNSVSFFGKCFFCHYMSHSRKYCPLLRCRTCLAYGHSGSGVAGCRDIANGRGAFPVGSFVRCVHSYILEAGARVEFELPEVRESAVTKTRRDTVTRGCF